MSDAVQAYQPGDQNIAEQVATYSLFGKLMRWCSLAVAVLLLTLVLWFCVNAGFIAGLFTGAIALAAGIFFLRSKPEPAH